MMLTSPITETSPTREYGAGAKVRVSSTPLCDLMIVNIDHHEDERGFFMESWNSRDFSQAGLPCTFVQDSHSASVRGVVRGLHYQRMTAPVAKLVRCIVGRILDVVVDLRMSSTTFGKWFCIELNARNKTQLFVPVGFAHGFAALSERCEVQYKQTGFYDPAAEGGLLWNDPDIGICWPFQSPMLSVKDRSQETLREYLKNPAFD